MTEPTTSSMRDTVTGSKSSVEDVTLAERIALLGAFEPRRLIGLASDATPSDEDVRTLSALSTLCIEVPRIGGPVQWSMTADSRRHALAALADGGRLRAVAELSAPESGDRLGRALRRLITDRMRNPVLMSRDEIEATYRACQFLRPIGIDYDVWKLEEIMRRW
jgi:hypothetical protein